MYMSFHFVCQFRSEACKDDATLGLGLAVKSDWTVLNLKPSFIDTDRAHVLVLCIFVSLCEH